MTTTLELTITGLCALLLTPVGDGAYEGKLLIVDTTSPIVASDDPSITERVRLPQHTPRLSFRAIDWVKTNRTAASTTEVFVDGQGEEMVNLPLNPWLYDADVMTLDIRISWKGMSDAAVLTTSEHFTDRVPNLHHFGLESVVAEDSPGVVAAVTQLPPGALRSGRVLRAGSVPLEVYYGSDPATTHHLSNHIVLVSEVPGDRVLNITIGGVTHTLQPPFQRDSEGSLDTTAGREILRVGISNVPDDLVLGDREIEENEPVTHLAFYRQLFQAGDFKLPRIAQGFQYTKTGSGICPGTHVVIP